MKSLLLVVAAASLSLPTLNTRAELPPSAYEQMQSEATEALKINVLRVTRSAGASDDSEVVSVLAEVLKVDRTSANIKVGDMITIQYDHITKRPPGWVGPGQVPIPQEGTETVAFLKPIKDKTEFEPAAGAMTFSQF